MGQSYFIWKGIDCRSMGVTLAGPVPIVRPEERVEHVQIPGRSGDLTYTEGVNIYNSYIQTATIQVRGGYRMREVWNWLRGSGYVTFSAEPDRRQKARIIGAITLDRHSKNMDVWVGEVQFYCQPLKEALTEQTDSASTATLHPNIYIPGNEFTITGLTSGSEYVIDSEIMEVKPVGSSQLMTKNTSGDWPVIYPQMANYFAGSGWSKLTIERRERFL